MEKGEERKPIEAERGNEIETNASRKSLYPSLLSSPLVSFICLVTFFATIGREDQDRKQPLPISAAGSLSRTK